MFVGQGRVQGYEVQNVGSGHYGAAEAPSFFGMEEQIKL